MLHVCIFCKLLVSKGEIDFVRMCELVYVLGSRLQVQLQVCLTLNNAERRLHAMYVCICIYVMNLGSR